MTASIVERLRVYTAAIAGEPTDLKVGPRMCADAMSEAATLIEKLGEKLLLFVEIIDGTGATGFDPHVEQMLIDTAEEAREALSLISGEDKVSGADPALSPSATEPVPVSALPGNDPGEGRIPEIAANLTSLERSLLAGYEKGWGSWMFTCAAGLAAKGLARGENGSYRWTPLGEEVADYIRASDREGAER